MTVAAVILTYNRKEILGKCLMAVAAQTRGCDEIVVVDNASTDGTSAMLEQEWAGRVTILTLEQNIGAAGGFNTGMKLAFRKGHDYIWVMDDDVIPAPDALEHLQTSFDHLTSLKLTAPFVVSNATDPSGLCTNTPDISLQKDERSFEAWPLLLHHTIVPVKRATFVSILFPRTTLQRYGLPIREMFIWGEDFEYTARVSQNRPGYLIGKSKVVHVRAIPGSINVFTETNRTRIGYFYHLKRNQMFMRRHLRDGSPVRHVLHQVPIAGKLILSGQFRKTWLVILGTLHGLFFNPIIEPAEG